LSNAAPLAVWSISAATIAAILLRPWRIGEWLWAVAGAALIVAAGLLPASDAGRAAYDGFDVYLFLAGMLVLAEIARVHGVFDWLAQNALRRGAGAPARRAFAWTYAAGIAVTALLSNDGTIVLLTPAVLAIAARARIAALPLLYACAFVANAASFVLPISNPANLVVFRHLPPLGAWLAAFALPSAAALLCTYAVLRVLFRAQLRGVLPKIVDVRPLSPAGKAALATVSVSAALLVLSAALERPIGATAFGAGAASMLIVALFDRRGTVRIAREAPWSIIPLVAALFVIVRALDESGALRNALHFLHYAGTLPAVAANMLTGGAVTLGDALLNNLPAGVLARYSLAAAGVPDHIVHATLIGVDLGPNLSITGSLATLLWLMMLRRDGIEVTGKQFLRIGVLVAIPSLVIALLCVG
jgi:arsenical pump membrane protein